MYSYDFFNKGQLTAFRCLDEPYILIDKEDMSRVLSVHGNWVFKNGNVQLINHQKEEDHIYLSEYLLHDRKSRIKQINNNPCDFRKRNLQLKDQSYSPFFMRPAPNLSKKSLTLNLTSPLSVSDCVHSIRNQQKFIGSLSLIPITTKSYCSLLQMDSPQKNAQTYASAYENDSEIFLLSSVTCNMNPTLSAYVFSYCKQFIDDLTLRNIHVHSLVTFDADAFSSVISSENNFNSSVVHSNGLIEIII